MIRHVKRAHRALLASDPAIATVPGPLRDHIDFAAEQIARSTARAAAGSMGAGLVLPRDVVAGGGYVHATAPTPP